MDGDFTGYIEMGRGIRTVLQIVPASVCEKKSPH